MEEQPKIAVGLSVAAVPAISVSSWTESEKANAIEPTHRSWWYEIDGLIRFFIVGVGTYTAFGFIYGHSEEQEKLEGQKINGSHDQICVQ